jgi:ribonuclease BN (tRNA processing enzyme)
MLPNYFSVLGAYGSYQKQKGCTCFKLGDSTLIDAGSVFDSLTRKQILNIDKVLLSHSHFDHIKDLPFLFEGHLRDREKTVEVYGSLETINSVKEHIFNDIVWPKFHKINLNNGKPVVVFKLIDTESVIEFEGLSVSVFEAVHSVPCYGFVIKGQKNNVVISSDTLINPLIPKICESLQGKTTLFIECSYPNEYKELAKTTFHLTPEDVFNNVKTINQTIDLFTYHIKPDFETEILQQLNCFLSSLSNVQFKGFAKPNS